MSDLVFKYDSIDQSTSLIVKQRTSEIKSLMRKTAQGIVEIGHKLIEVKEELPHGEFGNWLDAEFGWSHDTANRFMNVARNFEITQIAEFDIAPSALYQLSSPSTPEKAREEAIERAEQGESISHSTAKEITDSHKDSSNIGNGSPSKEDFEYNEETLDKQTNRISNIESPEPTDDDMRKEFARRKKLKKESAVGLEVAEKVLSQLTTIPADDPERSEAFNMIIDWINNNR